MMKTNYQAKLLEVINNLDGKGKLLLHSCCAPCSSYVLLFLKDYFDITVLYYNPNIEPREEYEKRKAEQKKLIKDLNAGISFLDCDYDNDYFHARTKNLINEPERGARCPTCFMIRLEKTASLAKKYNFDYFATTLTVSPYKNSQQINILGSLLEKKYNVKYLYSDFKKNDGYKKSIKLSNEYNLYRQKFCGCKYSQNKGE